MSRVLFSVGLVCLSLGAIAWAMERAGLKPGRLPGDIVAGSGGARLYIPITTCILLSVVLSAIMAVARALRK
ncbi:MAG TPA: DUF2905 domain-containing protein [Armatimonadota bacterium]|jgi:hypothetical protein